MVARLNEHAHHGGVDDAPLHSSVEIMRKQHDQEASLEESICWLAYSVPTIPDSDPMVALFRRARFSSQGLLAGVGVNLVEG